MPEPNLTALTVGYRKTPVLQIGADIYCDSQLIMRELERQYPTPSFYPAGRGAADALDLVGREDHVPPRRQHRLRQAARGVA